VDFAERLSAVRALRGLTQQQLADAAGVHVTQFRRYEAGTAEPSLRVLRSLAIALSVSADELLFDEQRGPGNGSLMLVLEAAERLGPEEQAAITLLVEGLAARAAALDHRPRPRKR
jgi:transcriptional regulator with XRE-family HTH domain